MEGRSREEELLLTKFMHWALEFHLIVNRLISGQEEYNLFIIGKVVPLIGSAA